MREGDPLIPDSVSMQGYGDDIRPSMDFIIQRPASIESEEEKFRKRAESSKVSLYTCSLFLGGGLSWLIWCSATGPGCFEDVQDEGLPCQTEYGHRKTYAPFFLRVSFLRDKWGHSFPPH